MKEDKKQSTKEDILKVVLKHIAEKGTPDATIREIAKLANVNSAAISYYFGSKDNLIQEACKHYYDITNELFEELKAENSNPKEKLLHFLIKYTKHMLNYPGFLKAQISQYIQEDATRPELENWIGSNINLFKDAISDATGINDSEILNFKSIQIFSGIVFPFLLNKYRNAIEHWDYYDKGLREKYIKSMLDSILTDIKNN